MLSRALLDGWDPGNRRRPTSGARLYDSRTGESGTELHELEKEVQLWRERALGIVVAMSLWSCRVVSGYQ